MVAIWSPSFVGGAARRLGGTQTVVADQRSLAEKHCSMYTERRSFVKIIVQEREHE
jgi:hypothetical protein